MKVALRYQLHLQSVVAVQLDDKLLKLAKTAQVAAMPMCLL